MRASVREQIIYTYIEKKVQIVSSNVSYDEHRTCCRLTACSNSLYMI